VTSKSTECPWRGALTKTEGGWRVEVMHDEHNHKLIEGSSPPRTIKKRQQAKVPLRTTNEFLPCQTQGALELRAEPSDGVQSTPSRLGLGPSHTPSVTPQPSPTPVHPTLSAVVPENASVISQTRSMTPPGEPLSRTTIQDYPPVFPQVASSRRRRGGYSIMSKIKVRPYLKIRYRS
jgi:hypothetical protein